MARSGGSGTAPATQGRTVKPYDLSVSVSPRFVPEQSDPGEQQFVFAYTVRITNTGEHPAQVISRHWIITDGNQRVQEVRGLGIVGQQPLLAPGETFEYTSGCPLPTPVGTMRGTYHCVGENGIPFEVPISEFVLAMPRTLH
jgi:ApaG protein